MARSRSTVVPRVVVDRSGARRDLTGVADRPDALTSVVVVVPARDEAADIAACLASIDRAAAGVTLDVTVVVAADRCRDETVTVGRSVPMAHCRLEVIEGRWGAAGPARRAAVDAGLGSIAADRSSVWLASTDADCVVPPTWLQRQLRHAGRGKAAVAGIVTLDHRATPAHLLAEFAATYRLGDGVHHHVHAANLGVRADVYESVGGWSRHTVVGEDHVLWRRLRAAGFDVHQPIDVAVTTSSRVAGRVVAGFASRLARLGRHPEPVRSAS